MKNNLLKYYIVIFYCCSTIVTYADPGSNSDTGGLEGNDAPVPINNYLVILAVVGLLFAYKKLKTRTTIKNTHI